MKVLVVGDFCPWNRVAIAIAQQDYSCLDLVMEYIKEVDYAIVNLECPIVTSNVRPIKKSGPNLCASENAIKIVKDAGFRAVTLANNHFRDYGDDGVRSTIDVLDQYEIDHVGGGRNIEEASQILYKEIDGKKIAIISCCENECSIADINRGGSNPINPIQQYYAIQEARRLADVVLLIVHGGIEHYQYPTLRMQELYRFYIDAGVDAVINHHQHCYSGYEVYKNKPIFYGLGNFCFDRRDKRHDKYNEGYMVELNIDKQITFNVIPYVQCDEKPNVRPMNQEEQNEFNIKLSQINSVVANQELLRLEYQRLLDNTYRQYQFYVESYSSKLLRFLFKKKLLPRFMRKKYIVLQNVIRCESHRERLLYALK